MSWAMAWNGEVGAATGAGFAQVNSCSEEMPAVAQMEMQLAIFTRLISFLKFASTKLKAPLDAVKVEISAGFQPVASVISCTTEGLTEPSDAPGAAATAKTSNSVVLLLGRL